MTVYLLHFAKPYKHARHYVGYTDNLSRRLSEHKRGKSARLMEVIKQAGITFECVRTWNEDRVFERRIKTGYHDVPKLCPLCNPEGWQNRLPEEKS